MMAVYLSAIAVFALYLAAVPLKFAFVFHTKPQLLLRSGSSIFEGRFALRRALRKKQQKKRRLPGPDLLPPILAAAKYLLRHCRIDFLRASGVIAGPDAARTALLFGIFESIRHACAPLGGRVQILVSPDFSGAPSDLAFEGMIGLRAGHIICAAFLFALKYIEKRLEKWTISIRLKISCRPRWKASAT